LRQLSCRGSVATVRLYQTGVFRETGWQILARIGLAALNRDEALVLDPVQCGLSF